MSAFLSISPDPVTVNSVMLSFCVVADAAVATAHDGKALAKVAVTSTPAMSAAAAIPTIDLEFIDI
jgi:hypothetical protein